MTLILITGESGVGKTHFTRALVDKILRNNESMKLRIERREYFSIEEIRNLLDSDYLFIESQNKEDALLLRGVHIHLREGIEKLGMDSLDNLLLSIYATIQQSKSNARIRNTVMLSSDHCTITF